MKEDFTLFDTTTYQDLLKDIYTTTREKRGQINTILTDLTDKIDSVNDAFMMAPIIQQYLDISIKNDDALIKLAAVVQRLIAVDSKASTDDGVLLTDQEKEQLLKNLKEAAVSIKDPIVPVKKIKKLK